MRLPNFRSNHEANKSLLDNRWGSLVCGASSSLGVIPALDAPPRPICARAQTLGVDARVP
jgi:hypothetical protein